MAVFPGFDILLVAWGAAVLAYATVKHFYFGGVCIQVGATRTRTQNEPTAGGN
jgi:hypothetical protein